MKYTFTCYLFFWGICLCLIAPTARAENAPDQTIERVSEIRIAILSAEGKEAMWESVARQLIPAKAGDPFSLKTVESAVIALKDAGLFEFIHVPDPEKGDTGVVLAFELTPFRRIKDIRIKNAFPLFQREVLNVMRISVG